MNCVNIKSLVIAARIGKQIFIHKSEDTLEGVMQIACQGKNYSTILIDMNGILIENSFSE